MATRIFLILYILIVGCNTPKKSLSNSCGCKSAPPLRFVSGSIGNEAEYGIAIKESDSIYAAKKSRYILVPDTIRNHR